MICWQVATAVATVSWVFRDPRFDHRLLIVGTVLPLLDAVTGGTWVMHSLAFSVAVGILVIAGTVGRRPLRRRLLALPIGTMLYLVFSGAWNDADALWWPFNGAELGERSIPLVERGWPLTIVLELAGMAAVAWGVRRAGLTNPARLARFADDGRLDFVVN